jgi:hypothetical protein
MRARSSLHLGAMEEPPESEFEELHRLNRLIGYYMSPEALVSEQWPKAISKGITDADGRFTIQVPKRGTFCIAAFATRKIDRYEVERYGWILPLQPGANGKVFLNNNNLAQ